MLEVLNPELLLKVFSIEIDKPGNVIMVEISQETPTQTKNRLLKVIAQSEFKILAESYAFEEFSLDDFSNLAHQDALALVKDNEVWSQLIPCVDSNQELFKIFSFHFENCTDNSGFVGWLASHLKTELGTGVFVTCGQNIKRGGIFDYWGCPLEISEDVINEIEQLVVDHSDFDRGVQDLRESSKIESKLNHGS